MDSILQYLLYKILLCLLRLANGLANISNNSAFVIQFHTNYLRINGNQICLLDMLRNGMSHFSGNMIFRYVHALNELMSSRFHVNASFSWFSHISFSEFFIHLVQLLTMIMGKTYPNFKKFYK